MAEAARRQYNKLKMQTKAEIRQTIDQLLVGEFIVSLWAPWELAAAGKSLTRFLCRRTVSAGP